MSKLFCGLGWVGVLVSACALTVACNGTSDQRPPGDRDAHASSLQQALGATCENVTLLAKKTYNPSTWFDAERQFSSSKRFRLPQEVPVVSGNSGNHWVTFTYGDGGATVGCRYQGGASQAHPNSPAQLALATKYVFKSCANGLVPGAAFQASLLRLHLDNGDSYKPDTQVSMSLTEEQPCSGGQPTCNPATVTDGNPCTQDSCDAAGQPVFTARPAGVSCGDANLCNGDETCDGAGSCASGPPPSLDDGNPCSVDSCDPAVGPVHVPASVVTSCSDGNACNGVEQCNSAGACVAGAPASVDDGNPCTEDTCDALLGVLHTPKAQGAACSDGNACNGVEQCNSAGACVPGAPASVDDGNPCTEDSCDAQLGVLHVAKAQGAACSDGNACNGFEQCNAAGACVSGAPASVDDGNPCTADSCDPAVGPVHVPASVVTSCSDGNACNGVEQCNAAGACVPGASPSVDDGNPCTDDSCDAFLGALHAAKAQGAACSDGNACNGEELCDGAGSCSPGALQVPDDGNPCTADSCDPVLGARHTPLPAGVSCTDANLCNGVELCDGGGTCRPGTPVAVSDGIECTLDTCDPSTGLVTHPPAPAGTACQVDLCTQGAVCDGVSTLCMGGVRANIDDGVACTLDTCDPVTGPMHRPCAPIDQTVVTSVPAALEFLFTGTNPIQTGVTPSALVAQRLAGVHGTVVLTGGAALPNVVVSVVGHAELGQTITREDGAFDMAVNGGGQLTFDFKLKGFLEAQRSINVPWNQWAAVPTVTLITADPIVSPIDLSSSTTFQVAKGSVMVDADGSRQGTLLVPSGTSAVMEMPNGSTQPIINLNVRISEFTVGAEGPKKMPATLPPTSRYTYAFEVNADEAVAAGSNSIKFSQPLVYYVNNFLGFPAGEPVPVGSYNRRLGQWVPEKSGIVIKIVSATAGVANVDVTGDGVADTGTALTTIGITDAERAKLGSMYAVGMSLWRVLVPHFTSPYDLNYGGGPPSGAGSPPGPGDGGGGSGGSGGAGGSGGSGGTGAGGSGGTGAGGSGGTGAGGSGGAGAGGSGGAGAGGSGGAGAGGSGGAGAGGSGGAGAAGGGGGFGPGGGPGGPTPDDPCKRKGASSIECQTQTLHEDIPIAGTPFGLHYSSDRVPARANNQLSILLSTATVPAPLKRIDLEVVVAGKVYNQSFPPNPNQTTVFTWDGKDGFGRILQGTQSVSATVRYVYNIVYGSTSYFGDVPTHSLLGDVSGNRSTGEIYLERRFEGGVGTLWDTRPIGLAGWNLSPQHRYDENGHLLLFGNGDRRSTEGVKPLSLTSVYQVPSSGGQVKDIDAAPDGSLYVAFGARIERMSPTGAITAIAGNGSSGFMGDGGLALQAQINPQSIALAPDGSLYIAQDNRVRRIDTNGVINTIAGNGVAGDTGDQGSAAQATLRGPRQLAFGPDGSLYIACSSTVRRIDTAGVISTVAGIPFGSAYQDEVKATDTALNPLDIAVGSTGELFIFDGGNTSTIRRVDTAGTIHAFAGCRDCPINRAPGIPATSAGFGPGKGYVAVAGEGTVYFFTGNGSTPTHNAIFAVSSDGLLRRVAGSEEGSSFFPGQIATQIIDIGNFGLVVGPGGLYMGQSNQVLRAAPALPGFTVGSVPLASSDGAELYVFDSAGRHLSTQSTLTRATLYSFGYDPAGRLSTITDGNNNITTIEHDASGNPTGIVGPYGQRTQVGVDANGYLNRVTDPLGNSTSATYSTNGLMLSFTDARGFTGNMTYDASGRLLTDVDAAGATQTLTPSGNKSNWQSGLKTGENHTTSYTIVRPGSGEEQRVNTFPDGTQAISVTKNDGTHITTFPDGTVVATTMNVDPRWGQDAPLYSTKTTLPSGLTRTESQARIVTLTNAADPLSLVTLEDDFTLNGRTTKRVFDANTKAFTTTTPVGRKLFSTIDALGHVTQTQTNGLTVLNYFYDPRGRLETVTQGSRQQALSYFSTSDSKNGYLQQMTDALLQTTSFDRDAFGRVLSQVEPGNATTGFGWDQTGNLTAVTPPGKPQHKQGYGPVGLLSSYTPPPVPGVSAPATNFAYNLDRQDTTTTRPDGLTVQSTYDSAGKLHTTAWPTGTVTYDYFPTTPCVGCAPGKLKRLSGPGTSVIDVTYDGRLTKSARWSGIFGGTTSMGVAWTYDSDFRVIQENVDAAGTSSSITFGYDADSLTTCVSPTTCTPAGADALKLTYSATSGLISTGALGNLTETWTQNAQGELATYTVKNGATTIYAAEYDTSSAPRDALGRILTKRETTAAGTVRFDYVYDQRGRLDLVNKDGVLQLDPGYDANGNRISMATPNGSIAGSFDEQDRMTAYGSNVYSYTANGELLTKRNTVANAVTSYQYDVRGSLLGVDLPNGTSITYVVDGYGRRVGKKVNATLAKGWIYATGLQIVGETNAAGSLVSQFVYVDDTPGRQSPELMLKGGQIYRFLKDQVGSVRMVVNVTTGQIAQALTYDAFGRVLSDSNPGFQPFGFAGGLYDGDTSLVTFGARDYDSEAGRWTAKDPIIWDSGALNQYGYADFDPVNRIDPDGLFVGVDDAAEVEIAIIVGGAIIDIFVTILSPEDPGDNMCLVDQRTDPKDPNKEGEGGHRKVTPSKEPKHEKGDARRKRDKDGEKGDKRRPYQR